MDGPGREICTGLSADEIRQTNKWKKSAQDISALVLRYSQEYTSVKTLQKNGWLEMLECKSDCSSKCTVSPKVISFTQ